MTQTTAASDIWSVGCVVVEILTGHPPYFELQPMSALFRIVQVRRMCSGGGNVRHRGSGDGNVMQTSSGGGKVRQTGSSNKK